MDYVILAVSNLTSALFLFYMLQIVFGERLSAKGVLIIYNLVMLGSGISYYATTSDWIGAMVSILPYVAIEVIVFNFKSLFSLNLRGKQFKKRMKKETVIYSQQKSKKMLSLVFMIFAIVLLIVMTVLYISDQKNELKDLSLIGMVLAAALFVLSLFMKIFGKKQAVDLVILTVGVKHPRMFAFELNQLKMQEKTFLTDDRYIVDYVGKIHIRRKDSNQMTHHYLIANDQINYQSDMFNPYQSDIIEIVKQFERYSLKKINVSEIDGTYHVIKETNL